MSTLTDDYMIPMNQDIVKNKHKSKWDFIKYMVYYHNFYLYHNIPFILTSVLLVYFMDGPVWQKTITYLIASFSSWFFHWLAHKSRIFNLISGHRMHHQNKTTLFEDAHEFLSDVFAAGLGLMLINYAIRFISRFFMKKNSGFVFHNYVLLFFMISFPLVHLLTYHRILDESYHQEHHKQTKTN